MEDVAIAYGYNNLVKRVPATVTAGRELPLNQMTELLRMECAMAGKGSVLGLPDATRKEEGEGGSHLQVHPGDALDAQ